MDLGPRGVHDGNAGSNCTDLGEVPCLPPPGSELWSNLSPYVCCGGRL